MAHFLIFIPGARAAGHSLEEVGLADFVEGAEFCDPGTPPPELKLPRGVMWAWRKPGAELRMSFVPGEQLWVPAAPLDGLAAGRFQIGFWKDRSPGPADLARRYPNSGTVFQLDDGSEWLFPEATKLSRSIMLADDGSWKFEIHRKFHDFWLETDRWRKDLAAADVEGDAARTKFLYSQIVRYLIRALRLNYRVLPEVASHLRLFNTENVAPILLNVVASLGGESD